MRAIRRSARMRASRAYREITLTVDDIVAVRLDASCHYCGAMLPDDIAGLDRIDNAKGYTRANVLPCCPLCNYARGHLLTVEEFAAAMAVRTRSTGRGHAWDRARTRMCADDGRSFVWRGVRRIG